MLDHNKEPHPLDRWEFVLAINLTGSFNLTRLCLPHLASIDTDLHRSSKSDIPNDDGERGVIIFASSSAAVSKSHRVI
jgi:3-hydroxyacyl-CoA dehydrogenase / 3-hydroxy-2-methylbutyryl-CoA dehydrogenase